MPFSIAHEPFDFFDRTDSASRTNGGTVQAGGCARELKLARQRPTSYQSINKTRMKNISRPGRVRHVYPVGRGVMEFPSIPGQHPVAAGVAAVIFEPYRRCTSGKQRLRSGFPSNAPEYLDYLATAKPPRGQL